MFQGIIYQMVEYSTNANDNLLPNPPLAPWAFITAVGLRQLDAPIHPLCAEKRNKPKSTNIAC